jgi:hypothetical protein
VTSLWARWPAPARTSIGLANDRCSVGRWVAANPDGGQNLHETADWSPMSGAIAGFIARPMPNSKTVFFPVIVKNDPTIFLEEALNRVPGKGRGSTFPSREVGDRSWSSVLISMHSAASIVRIGNALYTHPDGDSCASADTGRTWTRIGSPSVFPDAMVQLISDGADLHGFFRIFRRFAAPTGVHLGVTSP